MNAYWVKWKVETYTRAGDGADWALTDSSAQGNALIVKPGECAEDVLGRRGVASSVSSTMKRQVTVLEQISI